MHLSDFTYHKPHTVEEACRILADSREGALLAGGTDLLVEMKQGLRRCSDMVSLAGIPGLKEIKMHRGSLEIGACATHNELAASETVRGFCAAIGEAASRIGTDQVRNTGTVGGNLCTGASCCDMAPILIALDAGLEIAGAGGTRTAPLKDFFVSHKETLLGRDEVVTKIVVPGLAPGTGARFEKYGLREAASISVASVAVMIRAEGGTCADARVVIGAVAPTPKISGHAGAALTGSRIAELAEDAPPLERAAAAAALDSLPVDDIRGSAGYRREIIKVITRRAVRAAVKSIREN